MKKKDIANVLKFILTYLYDNLALFDGKAQIAIHDNIKLVRMLDMLSVEFMIPKIYDFVFRIDPEFGLFAKVIAECGDGIFCQEYLSRYFHDRHRRFSTDTILENIYTRHCIINNTYTHYGMVQACIYYLYRNDFDRFRGVYKSLLYYNTEFVAANKGYRQHTENIHQIFYYIALIYERYDFLDILLRTRLIANGLESPIIVVVPAEIYNNVTSVEFWRLILKYPDNFWLSSIGIANAPKIAAKQIEAYDDTRDHVEYVYKNFQIPPMLINIEK